MAEIKDEKGVINVKETDPDKRTWHECLKNTYGLKSLIRLNLAKKGFDFTPAQLGSFLRRRRDCEAERKLAFEEVKDALEAKAFDQALNGNRDTLLIFCLKAKCGWIETTVNQNINTDLPIILSDIPRNLIKTENPTEE